MQDQIPSTQESQDLAPSTPTQESTDSSVQTPEHSAQASPDQAQGDQSAEATPSTQESVQTPEHSAPDQENGGDTQENGQDQAPTLPQPPLLPETNTPTDTQPPELPQDDGQKLEALKQEIAQAIKDNAGVIANTHYTLQGIAELLNISDDLFRFYRYHAETIKLNQEQYENLQANLQAITSYINQSLKQIAATHASNLELFTTTEALLDEAKALAQSAQADLEAVQKMLEISQELESNLAKLESAKAEIQAQLNLAQSMKEQIEALAPNILNEMRTQLLSDKEQYEREIEQAKTQTLSEIDTRLADFRQKLGELESKLQELEQASTQAAQEIEQAKTQALQALEQATTQSKGELTTHQQALKQELEQLIQNNGGTLPPTTTPPPTTPPPTTPPSTQEIEQAKTEALESITTAKTQALESIETQTQQSQNTISQALQEALEQIQDATPEPSPEQEQKPSRIFARLADYELEATL